MSNKAIFLPRMTEAIFAFMRLHPQFWNAEQLEDALSDCAKSEEWTAANIETVLMHHSDYKRFARVPACDRCNPLLNKSQTCRHPGAHYAFKIILAGESLLEQHERRQGKGKNDDDTEHTDQD